MKRCVVILVALLSLSAVAADDENVKAVKQEQDKLQGKWKVVSVESEGKQRTLAFDRYLVIDGDKWTFDVPSVSPRGKEEMTCSLNPTQNPRSIDLTIKSTKGPIKVFIDKGIYKFDKDTLTVCTAQTGKWDDSEERPKEFKTTATVGYIVVYERVEK